MCKWFGMSKSKTIYVPGHTLTAFNEHDRTGTCAICGPTQIVKGCKYKGKQYWRCRNSNQLAGAKEFKVRVLHTLTEINPTTRDATCSQCGPVRIYKCGFNADGSQAWVCQTTHAGRVKNPNTVIDDIRSRTFRARGPKRHTLLSMDPESRAGVCSSCGPVKICIHSAYGGRTVYRCNNANKHNQLQTRYKTSIEERIALEKAQDGRCLTCGRLPKGIGKNGSLCMDHDQEVENQTGGMLVRGLICEDCNLALGKAHHSVATLLRMARYLAHSATELSDRDIAAAQEIDPRYKAPLNGIPRLNSMLSLNGQPFGQDLLEALRGNAPDVASYVPDHIKALASPATAA